MHFHVPWSNEDTYSYIPYVVFLSWHDIFAPPSILTRTGIWYLKNIKLNICNCYTIITPLSHKYNICIGKHIFSTGQVNTVTSPWNSNTVVCMLTPLRMPDSCYTSIRVVATKYCSHIHGQRCLDRWVRGECSHVFRHHLCFRFYPKDN